MENTNSTQKSSVSKWAIISLICFIGMFASFGFIGKFEQIKYIILFFAVTSHLALFPLIVSLNAPEWSKFCGYSWVTVDIILSVGTINGIPDTTIAPFRLGLHAVVAFWPFGAALVNKGLVRIAGYLLAAAIGIVPLLGPALPKEALYAAMPFILFWLVSLAIHFKKVN